MSELNLDSMEQDELMEIWKKVHTAPVKTARELFPDRRQGYVSATQNLGAYAANKATAISCRLRGDIPAAQVYEKICDNIYAELPVWARTW